MVIDTQAQSQTASVPPLHFHLQNTHIMKLLRGLQVSIPNYICCTIQSKPLKNNHWSGKDTFGVR